MNYQALPKDALFVRIHWWDEEVEIFDSLEDLIREGLKDTSESYFGTLLSKEGQWGVSGPKTLLKEISHEEDLELKQLASDRAEVFKCWNSDPTQTIVTGCLASTDEATIYQGLREKSSKRGKTFEEFDLNDLVFEKI